MTTILSVAVLVILIAWLFPKTFFAPMLKGIFNRHSANVLTGILRFLGQLLSGILQFLLGLFDLIFSLLALPFRSKKKAVQGGGLHNDRFLGFWQSRKLLSIRHTGVTLGTVSTSLKMAMEHTIIFGGTGSGKTTRVIIPTILKCPHSMVITDPSGELMEQCSGALKAKGFVVHSLDFSDPTRSLSFNPLLRCHDHSSIKKLVQVLIENAFPDSGANSKFWEILAGTILYLLIKMLKNAPVEHQNLANVLFLLESMGLDGSGLNDFVAEYADDDTFRQWKAVLVNDSKVLTSAVATAKAAIDSISDPAIASLTLKDTIDFESLRSKKVALFVRVPESEMSYWAYLTSLFFTQLLHWLMESGLSTNAAPVLLILDEFPHLGKIPNFSTTITTIRKRRCGLVLICQQPSQLVQVYSKAAADSILEGGCMTRVYLTGGMSLQTATDLEQILGRATFVYQDNEGQNREGVKNLLTRSELRTLGPDYAVFLYAGYPGKLLKLKPYFKQRKLVRLSRMASVKFRKRKLAKPSYVSLAGVPTGKPTPNPSLE